ncbi:ATP-binding protein [Candidatus Woesearchaeota archaeon CG10_big_fil_rev_8_21_14_0_10_45_16]|nr:MAG: ATP-binding protein [Candidatus Woesearchaeota archaeon CG10_big_fil_rev_8_21_14_0_10_45_16]
MCGIIGVFNHKDAVQQAEMALAILKNRGKDGSNIVTLDKVNVLGHTLHAVVNHVLQPIKKEGILTANCEIYNWEELNKKYGFSAENDAELLLQFLDRSGVEKIEELDGVFAFGYLKDNILILARDLLGVKPLWLVHTTDGFAFASEKKALEKLGHVDIQELNPRSILFYNIKDNNLEVKKRKFFDHLPEHTESYGSIKEKTEELLEKAIQKRIPNKKFGLLFSGGIDSTFLAKHFKDKGYDFTCYTAVLESETVPSDLESAQKVAKELGLTLKIKKIKQEDVPAYLQKIVPLIEDSNVVKVGVALTFYLACEMAKEDGCKVIFSGLGSEEIFAGYERHKRSANINQECVSGLLKMYERDLYRDDVLTMDNNLELRLPFLDKKLVDYCLKISEKHKIKEDVTKYILRDIAEGKGLPHEFAFRKKTAAQYGSRFDNALGKLARQNSFSSKSSYLRTFYHSHNLKLGVLFSSGKDSLSAAYIMQKQNYGLACLITLKSKNPDSYMFQTAGTELVELQAEAMGLPLVEVETAGEKELELQDLEKAISLAKEQYKVEGIVSGALFSTYQRDRIEKICDKLGLKIFSPLWHKPQEQHMKEVIGNKLEVVITAVAADGFDRSWLGRRVDEKMLSDLQKLNLNVAGEGGEFESLVLDSPLFHKKIKLVKTRKEMDSACSGRLIIEEAELMEK